MLVILWSERRARKSSFHIEGNREGSVPFSMETKMTKADKLLKALREAKILINERQNYSNLVTCALLPIDYVITKAIAEAEGKALSVSMQWCGEHTRPDYYFEQSLEESKAPIDESATIAWLLSEVNDGAKRS